MADTPACAQQGPVMRRQVLAPASLPRPAFPGPATSMMRSSSSISAGVNRVRSALHEAAEDQVHFLDAPVGGAPQQALAADLVTVAGGGHCGALLPHPPLRRNPFPLKLAPCVHRSSTRSLPAPPASRASAASSTGCWPVSCGHRMAPPARRRASSTCCSTSPPASSTAASGPRIADLPREGVVTVEVTVGKHRPPPAVQQARALSRRGLTTRPEPSRWCSSTPMPTA